MRSLDTNVLLRAILRDDIAQTHIVVELLELPALVTITVVQETFWVLTSHASFSVVAAVDALRRLMALPMINFANSEAVGWALGKAAAGADFADMLHLAQSGAADSFATFDRGIARHADNTTPPVETLQTSTASRP